MKTYSEKLKDPRWQHKRLEIMERDGFKCRACGSSEKTLNIHHIRYLQGVEPWEYKEFYLVTLCEDCHLEEEYCVGSKDRPKPKASWSPPPEKSIHPVVSCLCHLAIISKDATGLMSARMDEIRDAANWLKGVPVLERSILGTVTNEDKAELGEDYHWTVTHAINPIQDAERVLRQLRCVVLQRRDSKIKADLKVPGLTKERLFSIIEEAKAISAELRGLDRRWEFDDELPSSVFRSSYPKWQSKSGGRGSR